MHPLILIVDDDPGIRIVLQRLLYGEGYLTMLAEDGAAGLACMAQQIPSLVLFDYQMPRMNGAAFTQAVEQRGWRERMPMILMTAGTEMVERRRATHADGILAKPFDLTTLVATVAHHVVTAA